MLSKIVNTFFKPRYKYQPLVEVLVFKDNLLNNLRVFQNAYPKLKIAPVLKSNAYGHGLLPVARILDGQDGIPFIIVDSYYEALTLRQLGIKLKILIIGYSTGEQIKQKPLKQVVFTLINIEDLRNLSRNLKKPRFFHLKIDTGMHRQGISLEELDEAITLIKNNSNIILEGICSHLADADAKDEAFTLSQIENWNKVVKKFQVQFPKIKFIHLAATAGSHFSDKIEANTIRAGLGFYGISSSPKLDLALKPALALKSRITSLRKIQAGERVGYNGIYVADKETLIASIPTGYFEGLDRRLSGKGFVKIRGKLCPLAGRVSMNIISVNVSEIPDIKIGDEVVVISENPLDKNSVEQIAQTCDTIPYEILVRIPQHLRRNVV